MFPYYNRFVSNTETLSGIILWGIYIIAGLVILYFLKIIIAIILLIVSQIVEIVSPKAAKAIGDFASKLSDDDNSY